MKSSRARSCLAGAASLALAMLSAQGADTPDFRYPKDGVTAELLAECKARGITITDWHLHIRGGMTPEMAVARERASGIRSSAMENHGREWEIFTNARLREFAAAARKANPDMPVGIQVNDRDWFRQIDPATRAKFDYILADTMIMGKLPNGRDKRLWLVKDIADIGDPEKWMDAYVAHNLQILGEPISILANPTYLPARCRPARSSRRRGSSSSQRRWAQSSRSAPTTSIRVPRTFRAGLRPSGCSTSTETTSGRPRACVT